MLVKYSFRDSNKLIDLYKAKTGNNLDKFPTKKLNAKVFSNLCNTRREMDTFIFDNLMMRIVEESLMELESQL